MKSHLFFLSLAISALALAAPPGDCVDILVPENYATIQEAINNANYGETVLVGIGRFDENVDLKQGVNLHGSGPYLTTIIGQGGNSVITAKNDCTIQGLTIASGSSDSGID